MRERIEKIRAENRVKAQLHRWYSFYERPGRDVNDQLDILTPDVFINSTLAQCRGHEQALQSFAALPNGARHTHRLQAFDAESKGGEGDGLQMTAKIIYQTISSDSVLHSSSLRYAADLVAGPGPMPRFKEINITFDEELDLPVFIDAYAEHRVLATMLTWLSHVEAPQHGPAGLQALVADEGLEIHLSSQPDPITTYAELARWFDASASQVELSSHRVERLRIVEVTKEHYRTSAELAWEGITKSGEQMAARTRHEWHLIDKGERFARIQKMKVTALEPFRRT